MVNDARESVSQPTTSGGERGKHLFGIFLQTMDMEILTGVASEAPEITSTLTLREQALSTVCCHVYPDHLLSNWGKASSNKMPVMGVAVKTSPTAGETE